MHFNVKNWRFIYSEIQFGIIRFGMVNDTESLVLSYSVFTCFSRTLKIIFITTQNMNVIFFRTFLMILPQFAYTLAWNFVTLLLAFEHSKAAARSSFNSKSLSTRSSTTKVLKTGKIKNDVGGRFQKKVKSKYNPHTNRERVLLYSL